MDFPRLPLGHGLTKVMLKSYYHSIQTINKSC